MKEFSRSRETKKSFREHAKLFWGAVIKKTWGAGSRGLNFEGSGEQGTPLAEPQICMGLYRDLFQDILFTLKNA